MQKATRLWRMGVVAAVCAAMGLLSGCFLLPNDAPIASFTATPDSGSAPLSVAFDASDSYDPDGGVASYRWTFGDGATGYGVFVTHVYATPGTYTAELTVQDLRRATGVAFEPIEVRAGTKYAIIVGIAAYAPPTPQLTYTDDDAMALRDRLASLPGWSADRITLLLNHEATVAAFRAALDALAGASPDDLLVVHFSGHGNYYKDGNGDEADGFDEALEFYDTALVDDTLALLLEQVPMSRIAVTIDTCYSGGQLDSRAVRGASADGARAVRRCTAHSPRIKLPSRIAGVDGHGNPAHRDLLEKQGEGVIDERRVVELESFIEPVGLVAVPVLVVVAVSGEVHDEEIVRAGSSKGIQRRAEGGHRRFVIEEQGDPVRTPPWQ